jgi:diguanylate cyclase (GGDEF)-like protein
VKLARAGLAAAPLMAAVGYALPASRAPAGLVVAGGVLQVLAAVLVATEVRVLRRTCTQDPLTGLHNRRQLERRLAEALAARARRGGRVALVLLDVDGFKQVNDRRGHPAGDRMLTELAGTLAAVTRRSEVLARWGGDEFALLLPEGDEAEAAAAAARLQAAARGAGMQLSVGWAAVDGAEMPRTLFERADAHLYESKRGRR